MTASMTLGPCPFCGTALSPYTTHRFGELWYSHPKNGCVLDDFRVPSAATAAWGARASADAIETAEKALEHILAGALSLPRFADEEARDALAKLRDNR